MKRLCSLILILGVLAALTVPALADVIWEPADDFFFEHRGECTYVEYQYEAMQDTALYADPEAAPGNPIPAGSLLWVQYLWGEDWGATEWISEDSGYAEGWVRLEDFRRLYSKVDFEADHRAEFVTEEGAVPVTAEETTYIWSFPGSGAVSDSFGGSEGWVPEDDGIGYGTVYTDETGLQWGEVGYYYGARGWVCISDPHNDALPRTAPKYADGTDAPTEAPAEDPAATEAPSPAEEPAPTEAPASPVPAESGGFPVLPVVIVAAVIVVTVVLLLLLRKRDGSEKG